jgi:hypothetical protein
MMEKEYHSQRKNFQITKSVPTTVNSSRQHEKRKAHTKKNKSNSETDKIPYIFKRFNLKKIRTSQEGWGIERKCEIDQ